MLEELSPPLQPPQHQMLPLLLGVSHSSTASRAEGSQELS